MSRPGYTATVPDGHYCVGDPDDPDRLTLWSVTDGVVRDWPEGARWRPNPPAGVSRDERQAWYEDHYFPWRAQVAEAIDRDPDKAAKAFVAEAGEVAPPAKPKRVRRPQSRVRKPVALPKPRRAEAALMVAAIMATGRSCRGTARLLGVSKSTAHRLGAAEVVEDASRDAITLAVTMVRVEQLSDQLLVQRVTARGEDVDRVDRMIDDVQQMREVLRERARAAGWSG